MESKSNRTPLVVLVGQTASGKTKIAIELAKRFNGEIICADSRTIYEGMDIGTAKPNNKEQMAVPHHLLDITTVDRPITVAQYKKLAERAIADISARGKLPFLVGGTGLYVDAVVFDFSFRGEPDYSRRRELEELSVGELQSLLHEEGIPLPSNDKNPRHLIRQLESRGQKPGATERTNTLILGIELERAELETRVHDRVDQMIAQGLEQEAKQLATKYGWEHTPLETIGYKEFKDYFAGAINKVQLKELITRHTLQYAKRQKTWFKRNKSISWICKTEEAVDLITTVLNKTI